MPAHTACCSKLPDTYLMYDPAPLLVDPHNEYCFEELRARGWMQQRGLSAEDFPVQVRAFCVGDVDGASKYPLIPRVALVTTYLRLHVCE